MKYFVISDIQAPMEDRRAVAAVTEAVKDYKPDVLLCVGDEADSPEPARWSKGLAAEFAGTLQSGLDRTHQIMAEFREAIGKKTPFIVMRSNHADRISKYVSKFAPALSSLRALDYETLLGYEELGIDFKHEPFEFTKGWVLAHGDEGSLIRTPAGTAMNLAKRWNRSVVCGHTHRLGLQHDHGALNSKVTGLRFGMEVGHLMDMRKATYLKAGSANWQAGVGTIETDGNGRAFPSAVPIVGNRFMLNGRAYLCR